MKSVVAALLLILLLSLGFYAGWFFHQMDSAAMSASMNAQITINLAEKHPDEPLPTEMDLMLRNSFLTLGSVHSFLIFPDTREFAERSMLPIVGFWKKRPRNRDYVPLHFSEQAEEDILLHEEYIDSLIEMFGKGG